MVCRGETGSICKQVNVVYKHICKLCKSVGKKAIYWGHSSRSVGERVGEHDGQLTGSSSKSHAYQHLLEHHQDVLARERDADAADRYKHFEWKVHSSCRTSFERVVREAIVIKLSMADGSITTMNARDEYGHYEIPELGIKGEKEPYKPPSPTHLYMPPTTANTSSGNKRTGDLLINKQGKRPRLDQELILPPFVAELDIATKMSTWNWLEERIWEKLGIGTNIVTPTGGSRCVGVSSLEDGGRVDTKHDMIQRDWSQEEEADAGASDGIGVERTSCSIKSDASEAEQMVPVDLELDGDTTTDANADTQVELVDDNIFLVARDEGKSGLVYQSEHGNKKKQLNLTEPVEENECGRKAWGQFWRERTKERTRTKTAFLSPSLKKRRPSVRGLVLGIETRTRSERDVGHPGVEDRRQDIRKFVERRDREPSELLPTTMILSDKEDKI